ncbi:MAG TPA: hypothetical protein PKA13_10745 [Geminicoccaceae bacterium]|nr:hypothetical protein [Geminicoccus sp.]HMU50243.1 hypothetical protein [Geminicoccaceae bacterium]
MRDQKKWPAALEEAAGLLLPCRGEDMEMIPAIRASLICEPEEINKWHDVVLLLLSQLTVSTRLAILAASWQRPVENGDGLRIINNQVKAQKARLDPVAAYFGWLRNEYGGYVNLYGDGRSSGVIFYPTHDPETMACLGLCRAGRSDRTRTVPNFLLRWEAE